jgi:hypothetical protein
VRIIRIDPARKRIGLSMRRVEGDDGDYPIDDTVLDYDEAELNGDGATSAAPGAASNGETPA